MPPVIHRQDSAPGHGRRRARRCSAGSARVGACSGAVSV